MKLYGIPNCGTVKKARAALEARDLAYAFVDYKKAPIDAALLQDWLAQVGWKSLLKKTGPTWAKLPDDTKAGIHDDASALPVLLAHPNVIKRPVLTRNGKVIATGFDAAHYESL